VAKALSLHNELPEDRVETNIVRGMAELSWNSLREAHSRGRDSEARADASVDRDIDMRRVVNVSVAAVSLTVAVPVMLLTALAVRLDSPGPIVYTQVRVGLDRRRRRGTTTSRERRVEDIGGRPFTIYKFRSMRVDAEVGGTAVWAAKGDPRVTTLGRILRASRLDELPQLVNVLKGDMNIVGPRPERPQIFARLREDIAHYQVRQRARPGITGLAQINQAYDTCLDDVRKKVQYDLEYVRDSSVWDDLVIMTKTIPVMLLRRYGW
jgi:lipopolysaccharide/colanic/teichoic acid biosynthesis glycosyltransferase